MPRTAQQYDLSSKTKRKRRDKHEEFLLKPRSKPYFASIENKLTLGYVARWPAAGLWIARRETGRKLSESGIPYPVYEQWQVGQADDVSPPDGETVFAFEQAKRSAAAEAQRRATGKYRKGALTVRGAVEQYLAHLTAHKGADAAKDAESKLNVYVLGKAKREKKRLTRAQSLADVQVNRLTLGQLQQWQASLIRRKPDDPDAERRSKDTANRALATFKACLNHAFADEANSIQSDSAWRRLKAFRGVSARREDHFSEDDARALIESAEEPEFRNLLEAAFHTGARYGELAVLEVRHFDARRAQVFIPSGKTGSRVTTLTDEGTGFFKELARGRDRAAPLLPAPGGGKWEKSMQFRRINAAREAAKLPESVTFYAMRHTYVSRAIERGMPLTLVAENVGTSVKMIEENYGKFLAQARRELINKYAPTLRVVKGGKDAAA